MYHNINTQAMAIISSGYKKKIINLMETNESKDFTSSKKMYNRILETGRYLNKYVPLSLFNKIMPNEFHETNRDSYNKLRKYYSQLDLGLYLIKVLFTLKKNLDYNIVIDEKINVIIALNNHERFYLEVLGRMTMSPMINSIVLYNKQNLLKICTTIDESVRRAIEKNKNCFVKDLGMEFNIETFLSLEQDNKYLLNILNAKELNAKEIKDEIYLYEDPNLEVRDDSMHNILFPIKEEII